MKRFLPMLLCFAMALSILSAAALAAPETQEFSDVSKDSACYDAVMWAAENGIAKGVSADAFRPKAACTRGQMLTFLHRMVASPDPALIDLPFTDVTQALYCYKPVKWAYGSKITGGTSAAAFSPDAKCTRADALTFLWRTAGQPEPEHGDCPFTDVKEDSYYRSAVLWAVENGLAQGRSKTAFRPDAACTRGEAADILYRFING